MLYNFGYFTLTQGPERSILAIPGVLIASTSHLKLEKSFNLPAYLARAIVPPLRIAWSDDFWQPELRDGNSM